MRQRRRKTWAHHVVLLVVALTIALWLWTTAGRAGQDSGWTRVAEDLDALTMEGHGMRCLVVRGTRGMAAGAPALDCVALPASDWEKYQGKWRLQQ